MRPGELVLCAVAVLLFLLSILSLTSGCNKALCASDVSKCLIQVRESDLHAAFSFCTLSFSVKAGCCGQTALKGLLRSRLHLAEVAAGTRPRVDDALDS